MTQEEAKQMALTFAQIADDAMVYARPEPHVGKCSGLLGKLLGHHFEARYDTIPPTNVDEFEGSTSQWNMMVSSFTEHRYHHDVCTRCGKVVGPVERVGAIVEHG